MREAAEEARRALAEHAALAASAAGKLELAQAHRDNARAELTRVQSDLADARATIDDDAVEEAVRVHGEAVEGAQGRVAESTTALAAAGVQALDSRLADTRARLARARAAVETARAEFHDVKGRLEVTAAEGRHEAHERAEQLLEDARRRYDSVERRARAARHLHTALQRHRDQAHESYASPYAREIERLGEAVYGDSFTVTVDSSLVITHRELHGVRVPFDQLSGGAAEQLGILARLAVASMVDPDQGAPVVIDDALGFTDPDRLKRIGRVVGDAGVQHSGQIIVLTCTPHRYDGIAGAHRVTLSA